MTQKPVIFCARCGKAREADEVVEYARYKCVSCGLVNDVLNVTVREWLGFSYEQYLDEVLRFIREDRFDNLRASNRGELARGMLSKKQVDALKSALSDTFEEGGSIRDLRDRIRRDVKPGSLQLYRDGKKAGLVPAGVREISIARTETTRVANEGSISHYRKGGVEEYRWVASFSDRTCPQCEGLNGQVFFLGRGPVPPAHVLCRCTVVPKTELG